MKGYIVVVIIDNCDECYEEPISGIIHNNINTAKSELINFKINKSFNNQYPLLKIKEVEV